MPATGGLGQDDKGNETRVLKWNSSVTFSSSSTGQSSIIGGTYLSHPKLATLFSHGELSSKISCVILIEERQSALCCCGNIVLAFGFSPPLVTNPLPGCCRKSDYRPLYLLLSILKYDLRYCTNAASKRCTLLNTKVQVKWDRNRTTRTLLLNTGESWIRLNGNWLL